MLKIENAEVLGWEHAIRGMRNPKNSWEKSDSGVCATHGPAHCADCVYTDCHADDVEIGTKYILGPNDLKLMTTLRNAGTDHRKFMRMIMVYLDITAPLYWWKEFDTYKVGTVANSCSTMHKIAAKEFDVNDFSHEHIEELDGDEYNMSYDWFLRTVDILNYYRKKYNAASEKLKRDITDAERKHVLAQQKLFWWQLIQLLPSAYNQKRTVMLNYEVLANIYKSRRHHKLDEWHTLCDWIEDLPYSDLITGKGERADV
jgi:hypothetical protein|nr:MAG TPA: hypothetical protein [Caudoviricetes sp.]